MESLYDLFNKMRQGESLILKNRQPYIAESNGSDVEEECETFNEDVDESAHEVEGSVYQPSEQQQNVISNLVSATPVVGRLYKPAPKKLSQVVRVSFKCSICDKAYTDETDLLLHVRGIHGTLSNQEALRSFRYVCPVCKRAFRHSDDLLSHIDNMHQHPGESRRYNSWKCPRCSRAFVTRVKYETHKCMHRIQGYSCDVCGQRFDTLGSANGHCATKTKEKPFLCDYCGLRFMVYQQLWSHRQTHLVNYVERKKALESSPDGD